MFWTRSTREVFLLTAALLSFGMLRPSHGQTPAQDGQWANPFGLPLIAIHAALLPTGNVLLFSFEHGVPGIHGWVLDPQSLALTNVPPPAGWNPDCAGHSFLSDGRLLVAGGTLQFNPLLGSNRTYIFDPYSLQWLRVGDMADGRWYPTNITLPDGRVVTMSGIDGTTGQLNQDVEVWNPNGGINWQVVGQKLTPDYPNLHVLPNGLVFRSGPDSQTETFNPTTVTWAPVDVTNFPARYEAPSVLLPPTLNRVMLMGGYVETSGVPTKTVEIIDFDVPVPSWTVSSSMQFARIQHNAVILPDGKVMVVGGRSNSGNGTANADSVMVPEIFDPDTGIWDAVASHRVRRMYHSTALLLPDARVLVAGGDFRPSGEIYSPSYLFAGTRPAITSAPAAVAYGTSPGVSFTGGTAPFTISLISLSCVTHSNNMSQRYVRLGEVATSGTNVPAPANANIAPPGYYMLFVVDATGVPSISRMVRAITRFGDFDQDDDVDGMDRVAFESCFTGPGAGLGGFGCEPGDFDADGDIDCSDWDEFLVAWTAGGKPDDLTPCTATGVGPNPPTDSHPILTIRNPHPNPASGQITIDYELSVANAISLAVHDVAGRLVVELIKEESPTGSHSVIWNGLDSSGSRVVSGVYFAKLVAAGEVRTRLFVMAN